MANWIEQLDAQITHFLASWNIYTTIFALVLSAFILYPLLFWQEADTHPLLLARQARPSPVRNPGESATYRSLEIPHGYPLRSGLNVKDADAPRWSAGRDGDLRDIWRAVVKGGPGGERSKIMSVFGKDAVVEHDLDAISKEINIIGRQLQSSTGKRVAVYLPNSIECLSTLFACAFYGLSPVLLPYNQSQDIIMKLLADTGAECLIASAGSLPLTELSKSAPSSRQVIWVVEETSRQMDWSGSPDEARGKVDVSVWHELIEQNEARASSELPSSGGIEAADVSLVWLARQNAAPKIVQFSQKNIIAGTAALGSALPIRQRLNPSDLVLVADSFSNSYVLCQTLSALYSHASLAINSVAGPGADLALASRSISPTVIIASAESLAKLHASETAGTTNPLQRLAHTLQTRTLLDGRMPTNTVLSKLLGSGDCAISTTPGRLRLILASQRAGSEALQLDSSTLNDLRIYTKARICYALGASKVAGAVSQTNVYDYRGDDRPGHGHFGVPVSSVEIRLANKDDGLVGGNTPRGQIVASGPSVVGGEARLGVEGVFREDCTLAYA